MNVTKWDIFKFNSMLRRWQRNPISISEMLDEQTPRQVMFFMAERFQEFFNKNPKAVYPHFMVNSVEETGDKLLKMDLSGFHLDIGMTLGKKIHDGINLGHEPYHITDMYLTDLIDYFRFYKPKAGADYSIANTEIAIDVVRHIIASQMYIVLVMISQQFLATFNGNFIFTKNDIVTLGSAEDEDEFSRFCKHTMYEELDLDELLSSTVSSWANRALDKWMAGTHSIGEMEEKKVLFEGDAKEIISLAKTFENVDKDEMGDPFGADSPMVGFSALALNANGEEEDGDEISSVVESSLKGFFAYVSIFRSLGYGYNVGALSEQEWNSVMKSFYEFRDHCIT